MSTETPSALARLSDDDLMAELKRLAHCARDATALLIAYLAELDTRRLYLAAGFSSLFAYCTAALRLSESEAYNRIEVARTVRRFPVVLDLLRNGSVNLTTIRLLAPQLALENHQELLAAASERSRREVEELLARRFPQPPIASSVRKLPCARSVLPPPGPLPIALVTGTPSAPAILPAPATLQPPSRRAVVAPLAPDQYKVAFTANAETCRKLRLAQDLLRHQVPDGDPAEIIDRALSALLQELARKKLGASNRPRPSRGTAPGSRHISSEVKRAVWLRDGGRCAFVAKSGRRCGERGFLEFHHVEPHAAGGEATARNIALRCRPHNGYEAERHFGPREPAQLVSGTSCAMECEGSRTRLQASIPSG